MHWHHHHHLRWQTEFKGHRVHSFRCWTANASNCALHQQHIRWLECPHVSRFLLWNHKTIYCPLPLLRFPLSLLCIVHDHDSRRGSQKKKMNASWALTDNETVRFVDGQRTHDVCSSVERETFLGKCTSFDCVSSRFHSTLAALIEQLAVWDLNGRLPSRKSYGNLRWRLMALNSQHCKRWLKDSRKQFPNWFLGAPMIWLKCRSFSWQFFTVPRIDSTQTVAAHGFHKFKLKIIEMKHYSDLTGSGCGRGRQSLVIRIRGRFKPMTDHDQIHKSLGESVDGTHTHITRVDDKGGTEAEKDRTRNNNKFYGTNCVIRRPTFFLLFFSSFDLLGRVLYTHDTVKGRPFGHRIHFWVKVKRWERARQKLRRAKKDNPHD